MRRIQEQAESYISMHSLLRHYMEVSGQLPAPTALPTRKGAQVLTGCDAVVGDRRRGPFGKEILPPVRSQASTVQSVTWSLYRLTRDWSDPTCRNLP
jgi:hypothetical protein